MTIHRPIPDATSPISQWEMVRVREITLFVAGVEKSEGLKDGRLMNANR